MKNLIFYVFLILVIVSCNMKIPDDSLLSNENVKIYPDYARLTIPFNIAPLNFTIDQNADEYVTKVYSKKGKSIIIKGKDILFRKHQWEKLLSENKGDTIYFQIFIKMGNKWTKYPTIENYIANESIDNYLSYRLIEPGYDIYDEVSIQQRDITSFDEKTLYNSHLVSTASRGQCINCHSFQDYNRTGNMQIHFRGYNSGTLVTKDKKLEKYNLKTDSTISGGVYPTWHPSLNLIVYSVNAIGQTFHTKDIQKIEVRDKKSGLILYDIDKSEVKKIVDQPDMLETFPYWAPNGQTLYFASAEYTPELDDVEKDLALNYASIKYNLFKIPFNTQTLEFGQVDTVYNASAIGKSATFPRVSPNGRYLLFTMGDYGNFHIWHKSSDLYLMDIESGEVRNPEEINSTESESYHSWSSNGNWIVFSSRRLDGGYTRFYISYFDGRGNFHKPFVLPQKDPRFYQQFFKSFNVPEFLIKKVDFSPHDLLKATKTTSKKVAFQGLNEP